MKKILFRFFFIFFLLNIAPWYWVYQLPGVPYLLSFYEKTTLWTVEFFNRHLLHVKDTLNIDGGGSGDTSYAWAEFYTFLILALLGCMLWTFIHRKRQSDYNTIDFWLRTLVRYYVSMIAFSYGISKLFALQMPFPNLSQLATPLGDYLPMRLSWMFIGYSTPYEVFSGVAETIVGILLLNRRTVTLGALIGIGVFANVFVLNLCYDIPVKLYSMQILIYCIFLTVIDWRRVINFFLLNKDAEPTILYDIDLAKRWQKIGRIAVKTGFVILFVAMPLNRAWGRYKQSKIEERTPIKTGVYDIRTFVKNNDTIPVSKNEMAWKDFIFDKGGAGSISTLDTLFRQRYRRGYFTYLPDSISETIKFKKFATDSISIFEMKYKIVDEKTIVLWGTFRNDSLHFELERTNRHFQLTEKQFHWISESNR